jgi:predicted small secreted protein
MKRLVAILLIITALLISGCETFSGLGRDLERAGEWVQEKAN